jgi:hypothetical protein
MTTPTPPPDIDLTGQHHLLPPTEEVAIVQLPGVRPDQVVGGALRPGRAITVGRRRSDRWLARSIVTMLAFGIAFVLYTSYQLTQIAGKVCVP